MLYFHAVWCNLYFMENHNNYMKAFASNLRECIGDRSISEFAKEIGIPQQTISRYLACQREISLSYLCKIADFLNEDIDVLLGRKQY